MFKSVRWRSDKNKITAVYKLTFHASQVLQSGGSTLVLSVVPADGGKAAKLDKTEIRDDCCYWSSPLIETMKLVRDPKNGKIHDRNYRFIISTGSLKSTIVGEVSLNVSDYFEAAKPVSISLPFNSANSDSVLHVLIQRVLQDDVNKRDVEEHEIARFKREDRSLKRHFSMGEFDENIDTNCNEEMPVRNTTVPNLSDVDGNGNGNGNGRASTGSDITLSGSDNSSGSDALRELGMKTNDMISQHRAGWEWSLAAVHDSSTDGSTNSQRDDLDESVEKLKSDLLLLSRKAEMADMELQTLRKQIVKESKRGQELVKEVVSLRDERDAFKEECDKLKSSQSSRNKVNCEGDPWALLEETRRELSHEKDLNADLRLQLRKTQESNSELILAVQDLEQLLEKANKGELEAAPCNIPEKSEERKGETSSDDDDDEQKALEDLVKEHGDAKEVYILEQRIMDLCNEIELYRRDKDELEMQMEQLALDYEILKQENHDMSYKMEQSDLQQQLKMQYECSGSYATIHELENQVEKLEEELDHSLAIIKDLENQVKTRKSDLKELEGHIQNLEEELENRAHGFECDLEAITRAKVEQEQRAIRAEEELRLTRLKNANTAGRLQEEFRRLSNQMQSTFEANEKMTSKAMTEASQLRLMNDHLEELLEEARDELQSVKVEYDAQVSDLRNQLELKLKQMDEMIVEIKDKSINQEVCLSPSLKGKVEFLEGEIKQKEVDMETSTSTFLDKEKDLHYKIGDLERMVDGFVGVRGEQHDIEALLKEVAQLREESSFMGAELKEMQERYSEISLKFAEVEGERQRLVMTLRNARNTNKS